MNSSIPDIDPPDPAATPPPSDSSFSVKSALLLRAALLDAAAHSHGGRSPGVDRGHRRRHGASNFPRTSRFSSLTPGMIASARMRLSHGLDPEFKHADKDLVADPPADASRLVDPDTLSFSYIATDDPANAEKTWKPR